MIKNNIINNTMKLFFTLHLFVLSVSSAWLPPLHPKSLMRTTAPPPPPRLVHLDASTSPSNNDGNNQIDRSSSSSDNVSRRQAWMKTISRVASLGLSAAALMVLTRPAWASSKDRNIGYEVKKSKDEWKQQLSAMQYHILREGGTERPYFSVLGKFCSTIYTIRSMLCRLYSLFKSSLLCCFLFAYIQKERNVTVYINVPQMAQNFSSQKTNSIRVQVGHRLLVASLVSRSNK